MVTLPSELEPIADHILFQFLEEIDHGKRGVFKNTTDWGFEMASSLDDTTQTPRWVKIIGLGPDCPDYLHIGQTVLVAPLMWTRKVDYKGLEFSRTDPDNILAVDEET